MRSSTPISGVKLPSFFRMPIRDIGRLLLARRAGRARRCDPPPAPAAAPRRDGTKSSTFWAAGARRISSTFRPSRVTNPGVAAQPSFGGAAAVPFAPLSAAARTDGAGSTSSRPSTRERSRADRAGGRRRVHRWGSAMPCSIALPPILLQALWPAGRPWPLRHQLRRWACAWAPAETVLRQWRPRPSVDRLGVPPPGRPRWNLPNSRAHRCRRSAPRARPRRCGWRRTPGTAAIPSASPWPIRLTARWRNRAEFCQGREAIRQFLTRKWASASCDYRLIKELWACQGQPHRGPVCL